MVLCAAALALGRVPAGAQGATGAATPLRAGAIHGTVIDARTRQPLPDVLIQIDRTDRAVRTGPDGRFVLPDLEPGPHALYISIVGYILVKRDVVVPAGQILDVSLPLTEGTGTYVEEVTVTAADAPSAAPLVASQHTLGSADLQNLRGVLTDDPMRAVQALPGVAANDDLRSEFTVRGSDFRHIGVLIDGVESQTLLHAVRGTQDGGSLSMINSDVLERVTLLAGSYPQRFGNRTGAEIGFTLRTGSRDRAQTRTSVSGTSASIVMEGPLGRARKGSWIFSARKSYLDLIIDALFEEHDFDFGFIDTQAKVAYDVTPQHRIEGVIIAGRSRLHDNPATAGSGTIVDGTNDGGLATVAWIATRSPGLMVTQRISAEVSRFKNDNRTGLELEQNDRSGYAYRLDVTHALSPRVRYDAGVQARHLIENARRRRPEGSGFALRNAYDASADVVSAFGSLTRVWGSRWTTEAGARVDRATLTHQTVGSPWLEVALAAPRGLAFRAGTGLYHQFPDFDQVAGSRGSAGLEAERATHVDAGVEQRIGVGLSWRAVAFAREERGFVRLPDGEPRAVAGRVRFDPLTSRYENRLDGSARGFELSLQRKSAGGLSGWISYAYAATRQRDRATGESFRADFDQRHTFNAYAFQRLSSRLSVAAKIRAGTGTPLIGYFERRGGDIFLSDRRNLVELPDYLRADLRANHVFNWRRSRLTLFAEVINVFNRKNLRQSSFGINRTTGVTTGLLDTMVPIVPSAGILIEF